MNKKNKVRPDEGGDAKNGAYVTAKTPHRYPLELVANLAVQLIELGDYDSAAKRAVSLLDACTDVLEGRGKPPPPNVTFGPARPPDMRWDEFVRYLTDLPPGQSESKTKDFLRFQFRRYKACDRVEETDGTWAKRSAKWRRYIKEIPEPSTEEFELFYQEFLHRHSTTVAGESFFYISGGYAQTLKGQYAEWCEIESHNRAVENGSKPPADGKKRGRPQKNAESQK